jgi:hypothetical protein
VTDDEFSDDGNIDAEFNPAAKLDTTDVTAIQAKNWRRGLR